MVTLLHAEADAYLAWHAKEGIHFEPRHPHKSPGSKCLWSFQRIVKRGWGENVVTTADEELWASERMEQFQTWVQKILDKIDAPPDAPPDAPVA